MSGCWTGCFDFLMPAAPPVAANPVAAPATIEFKVKVAPLTTLTWFKGDFEAARLGLEKRMKRIIAKNPWLQGRISCTSFWKGTYHLSYAYTPDEKDDYDKINVDENFNVIDPTDSPVSREMPIVNQNDALLRSSIYFSDIFLETGPKEPLFKASIVPCATNPHDAFALVLQMSHALGDGATYYKVMNMLCSKDENEDSDGDDSNTIVELIPERIPNSKELQIEAMGETEHGYLTSTGFLGQTIYSMVLNQFRGPLKYDYNIFDPRSDEMQMEEVKRAHAKDSGLPFVSTNDVLTSWLMNHCTGSYGLMAINWRNRLEGHTDRHVGNYENILFYRKEDYASPGLIRKSLEQYKRVVTGSMELPSPWEMMKSQVKIVTNWSTFAKENVIDGCVEDLHFPLMLPEFVPAHKIRMLILFRAGQGKIGLLFPPDAMSDNVDTSDPFRGLADFLMKNSKDEDEN